MALTCDPPAVMTGGTTSIHLSNPAASWLSAPGVFTATIPGVTIGLVVFIDDHTAAAILTAGTATGIGTVADATTGTSCPLVVGKVVTKDSLTGASGVDLTARTADWTGDAYTAVVAGVILSGTMRLNGGGGLFADDAGGGPVALVYASGAAATAAVAVQAAITMATFTAFNAGIGVWDPAVGGYFDWFDGQNHIVYKVSPAGAFAAIGAAYPGIAYTAGEDRTTTVLVTINSPTSATIAVYEKGALLFSRTDTSAIVTARHAAIIGQGIGSATTGIQPSSPFQSLDLAPTATLFRRNLYDRAGSRGVS